MRLTSADKLVDSQTSGMKHNIRICMHWHEWCNVRERDNNITQNCFGKMSMRL